MGCGQRASGTAYHTAKSGHRTKVIVLLTLESRQVSPYSQVTPDTGNFDETLVEKDALLLVLRKIGTRRGQARRRTWWRSHLRRLRRSVPSVHERRGVPFPAILSRRAGRRNACCKCSAH